MGTALSMWYDRGRLVAKTEAAGTPQARTTTSTWHHPTFRVPTRIVRPGQTIDFTYDTDGRLLTRTTTDTQTRADPYPTNGNTRTWTYTYNSLGLVATIDGPRTDVPDVTTYGYAPNGDLTTITNALGHVTEITARDARGYPTAIRDPNGVVTALAYDARGRLTAQTVQSSQGDATTTFDYDPAGQLVAITLPDGSQLHYEYDDAQRLTAIENGLGERIELTLDARTGSAACARSPTRAAPPHTPTMTAATSSSSRATPAPRRSRSPTPTIWRTTSRRSPTRVDGR
jgi:YD repeat-containing protein